VRNRQPRLALAALLVAALAVGVWLTWRRFSASDSAASLVRLEEALAGPGAIALAHVDVARLRELAGPSAESALLAASGLREVEGRGEVSRVLLAVSRAAERTELAAVLLGRFDGAAIEAALGASSEGIEEALLAGERVLYIDRIDTETCRASRLGLALGPDRIVLADGAAIENLLTRLGGAGLGLEAARGTAFLTARWSGAPVPAELSEPGVRALLESLYAALGGATGMRASARTDLRGRLALELEIDAADAAGAAALLERWRAYREARRGEWSRSMPALARWSDALELAGEGSALRARAALAADDAALPQLADDALVFAASAFQASPSGLSQAAELWPSSFRESQPLAAVPAYRADAPLAGAADAIAGPFGIRIERVRGEEALEVELRAVGPDVPNLPAPDAAPLLVVESVQSEKGEDLLDGRGCGAGRPAQAQPLLRSSPAPLVEGIKLLRLRRGVGLDAVDSIRGRVELDLAVRTQSVRASELQPGTRLEGPGVSLELSALAPSGFAYRVHGERANLLYVRGLDAAGAPLAGREAWQVELPASGERIGALRHLGQLASVEAIFALERESGVFPFALESARPGSDGEAMHVESSSFIDYSPAQYDREFGSLKADPRTTRSGFAAQASAGPFQLGLGALVSEGVVAPQLKLIAPDIPNLTYNATGLELELTSVRLRDRRSFTPALRVPVAPGHRFGSLELEAELRPVTDIAAAAVDVERLAGQLILRLPSRVEVLELNEVEPGRGAAAGKVAFSLTELARDGFALRMRGPRGRFFSARAFGAEGQELAVKHTSIGALDAGGSREIRFRVQGQPRRLAIQLARGSATRRYPFELELPLALPAAPAATP
jgi:hypothetical protein